MKKIMLLLACASVMAASAQVSLVKSAAKAIGGKVEAQQEALEELQPALTNPETATDANTWFTAGKLAMGIVDKIEEQRILGQEVDVDLLGNSLFKGYEYLQKALPLDSVVEVDKKTGAPKLDKEGNKKIKTKYSKDILSLLTGHANDAMTVGDAFLNATKYGQAANAYEYYLNLIGSPAAKAFKLNVPADTILGNINFLVGYCTYFADGDKDYNKAFNSFTKALSLGYTANQTKAFRDAAFLAQVQALMADDNNKGKVLPFIDGALAGDPTAPNFYDIKGQVLLGDGKFDEAKALFKAAMDKDPNYGDSYLNYARALYEEADKFIADNQQMTDKQLAPTLIPLYEAALPFLERAIALDKSENQTLVKQANSLKEDIDYKFGLLGHKK